MRHFWLIFVLGCGGTSGERIEGDVAIEYGSSSPDLVVGAAVQDENDPALMLVQIGSDNVDCDTYLDRFLDFNLPSGTFVYFSVDKAAGSYADSFVSAMQTDDGSTKVNVASGSVTIDAVEPRVTGRVTLTTTDDEIGTIAVTGSFDVVRCF
ncbi:MAG TPA: hypothetical protein VNO30_27070 [Kofleriaceae bacterium]|nr:hypothetical protein [Kofleriaceae bacterium]